MLELAAKSLREGRLEGIIDEPKSGRWGNWVYYMRGKKQCCRRYVRPRDPRSPAQVHWRAALTAASKAWSHSRTLTQEDRQACRLAGAKVKTRRRLGQGGTQTGQLYFVGRECRRRGAEGRRQEAEGRPTGEASGAVEIRRPAAETQLKAAIRGCDRVCRRTGPGWSGRRRDTRSTWDEYRNASVTPRCQYRWGTGRGAENAGCRRRHGGGAGTRRNGHWRESWRGG